MIDFIFQIIGHIGVIIFIVLNIIFFYKPIIFEFNKEVNIKTPKNNFIHTHAIKSLLKIIFLMSAFAAMLTYYNLVRVLKLIALIIQYTKGA